MTSANGRDCEEPRERGLDFLLADIAQVIMGLVFF